VIVKAAHDANCLYDVLSAQDAAGITAATWLLRLGYSDFVALLPADSSLKVSGIIRATLSNAPCDSKAYVVSNQLRSALRLLTLITYTA
jgi:hypothetical protein